MKTALFCIAAALFSLAATTAYSPGLSFGYTIMSAMMLAMGLVVIFRGDDI